jgi:hypothetical protein
MLLAIFIKQNSVLPKLFDRRLAKDGQRVNRKLCVLFVGAFFRFGRVAFAEKQNAKEIDDLSLKLG